MEGFHGVVANTARYPDGRIGVDAGASEALGIGPGAGVVVLPLD
jgi:hypothetical protein